LSEEWKLIARIIMPVHQSAQSVSFLLRRVPSATGTGFDDFNPRFFFSPAKPGELIWGLGPTFTLPTSAAQRHRPDVARSIGLLVGGDTRRDTGGDCSDREQIKI
jgi:hypothetical protein